MEARDARDALVRLDTCSACLEKEERVYVPLSRRT
jgi:hypothetical protein